MYLVRSFYEKYAKSLGLLLLTGEKGLRRNIRRPEVHRPGLSLAGYLKNVVTKRVLIFGKIEIEYLKELDAVTRKERLERILTDQTPAVILAKKLSPLKELKEICEASHIPLFRSNLNATSCVSQITFLLNEEFAPSITLHGTLVELFGVGALIQGDSSVGKSEAALGLIERGHRLISDDVVKMKKREGSFLEGSGPELTRHLIEIRGIGIINVAHLYGAVCVRPSKGIDLIVKLEAWNDAHFYDRVGLEEKSMNILGVNVPYHLLPVKPGRDVVLLIETIALNHRLKEMGYHSAKEFNAKWLQTLNQKNLQRKNHENLQKSESKA